MKKILHLAVALFSVAIFAQVPSIVVDVNSSNLDPQNGSYKFYKSSFWHGKYYYQGKGDASSLKLCATGGTLSGTTIIKEFNNTGYLYDIIAVKDFLYFIIDNTSDVSISKKELWKTDGTTLGTVIVKTFITSTTINSQVKLISDQDTKENYSINENEIYFAGVSDEQGLELWKTNGTEATTILVKDVYAGANASIPSGFTRLGATIYFAIRYNTYPFSELWKTNGTATDTVPIGLDLYVYNSQIVPFKNKFYFYGFDGANGLEPWVSDGTLAGTRLLYNTSPQNQYFYSGPFRVFKSENYLVFFQENFAKNSFTSHLWKSDGTPSGTMRMTPENGLNIKPNGYGGQDNGMFDIDNDNLYSYATSPITLYKFNLQSNTNQSIALPVFSERIVRNFKFYNSELWFVSNVTATGHELWKTDFVTAGIFADINIGSSSSNPFGIFLNNNNFYFFSNNGSGNKLFSLTKDIIFNGSTNNNWNLASNWNSNATPSATDNVIIPSNKNVVIDANSYAKNITANSPIELNGGNLSFSGKLQLNSKISLSNNNLNLTGSSSSVSGAVPNYIVINGLGQVSVENVDANRGNITLPIGSTTNYNPITISNSGTSDTFSVRVEQGLAQNYSGNIQGTAIVEKSVNATWYINENTSGGSNATVKLQWNDSQELPSFDRLTAKIGHYSNSTFDFFTSTLAGSGPFNLQATGITSFSPFVVLNESALSRDGFAQKIKINVFPNPTNSLLNLSFANNLEKANLKIISILGQTVLEKQNVSGNNLSLDVSGLSMGTYIIQIKDGNFISTSKFIKQ